MIGYVAAVKVMGADGPKVDSESQIAFNEGVVNVDEQIDYYNVRDNRISIYERDGYTCYKCGKLLTRWDATLDHILPVSRGGKNTKDNVITCCLLCNSKRRNKEVELEGN